MKIKNIDGLSAADLQQEANQGGRFLYFTYTISLIIVTFKRTSDVYLVRRGESATGKVIAFSLLSFFFGWWGIPYGPVYTVECLRTNFRGGKDVTDEVMSTVAGYVLFRESEGNKLNRK